MGWAERSRGALLLPLLIAASACDGSLPAGARAPEAYLAATLSGAIEGHYAGSGWFHMGTVPQRSTAQAVFILASEGSAAGAARSLQLFGEAGERPGPGTYPVGLDAGAFRVAFFTRLGPGGEILEAFGAAQGELRITESTPSRIAGELRFDAFRYCARSSAGGVQDGACVLPDEPLAGAPTLRLVASFIAAGR